MKNPCRRVALAAGDDRRVLPRAVDVAGDLVERSPVDDGAHEVAEVLHVAHLDLVDHRDDAVAHAGQSERGM